MPRVRRVVVTTTQQLTRRPEPLEFTSNVRDRPKGAGSAELRPLLHHVQLKTTRLDQMIEWYCAVVGLVLAFKGMGGAWLTNDDANHRIALVTSPSLRDDPNKLAHTGMHHTAWEYRNIDELLSTYARLRDLGILPHRTVNHGPILSFYYLDPDGNSVELQVDNCADWRASSRFFETPEFAADPYGPGVDPEQLLAARAAGATAEELHRRSYAAEFPHVRPNDRRLPL
jgi:catechol 2,3-dioxygenase-like lactoylglutathione lyase family enzyme